jgi:hypothetical protein
MFCEAFRTEYTLESALELGVMKWSVLMSRMLQVVSRLAP